jgi:hypothetical protein
LPVILSSPKTPSQSSFNWNAVPAAAAKSPRRWTRESFENLGLHRLRGTIAYPEQPFWKQEAA